MTAETKPAQIESLVVLLDRADVDALDREGACRLQVLPLLPKAGAALVDCDASFRIVDARENFTDSAQLRVIDDVQTARKSFVERFRQSSGYSPVTREMVRVIFDRIAYSAMRFWHTLGDDGPWQVRVDGDWHLTANREAATALCVQRLFGPQLKEGFGDWSLKSPPAPWLFRRLRNALARIARRGNRLFVTGMYNEDGGVMDRLEKGEDGSALAIIRPTYFYRYSEYPRLLRSFWRALRGSGRMVFALTRVRPDAVAQVCWQSELNDCVDAIDVAAIRSAFRLVVPNLSRGLARAPGLEEEVSQIVRQLDPDMFVSIETSELASWLVAYVCGKHKVERVSVARNAHAPISDEPARDSAYRYFEARFPRDMTDAVLVWTPAMQSCARQVYPDMPTVRFCRGSREFGTGSNYARRRQHQVLLADSYASWGFTQSWIYQTSDEFIDGANALIDAMASIPECRLVIRAKEKRECGERELRTLFRETGNYEIKMRDSDIRSDLELSDLVVSFRSTVVDEALLARRPVLLWGSTNRYRYYPARSEPPSKGDRAAIYTVHDARVLPIMISQILAAHAGVPLTDSELEQVQWDEPVPGAVEAIQHLTTEAGYKRCGRLQEASELPAACNADAI